MSKAIALGLTCVPRLDLDHFESQSDSARLNQRFPKRKAMLIGTSASVLILVLSSSSLCAQSSLQWGLVDFQDTNEQEFEMRTRHGWLAQPKLLIRCNYPLTSVKNTGISDYDYLIQQSDLVTEYYFKDRGTTLPYLGLEVGWRKTRYGSVRESGLFLGSKAGIKFFLNQSVSIDTSISFRFRTYDLLIVDYRTYDNNISPSIGLKARF